MDCETPIPKKIIFSLNRSNIEAYSLPSVEEPCLLVEYWFLYGSLSLVE